VGLGISIKAGGAKADDLEAASEVVVSQCLGEVSRYRIRVELVENESDFGVLNNDAYAGGGPLSIVAPVGGEDHYLVQGPVTTQRIWMEHGIANSYVDITGADNSVAMMREQKVAVWSDVSDDEAATQIFGQYQFTPKTGSPTARHQSTKHPLLQRDTDYHFVRRLAVRNGFYFWITSDQTGDTANFRRPDLESPPAATLSINKKGENNIDSLEILWDAERPVAVDAAEVNAADKSDITATVTESPLALLGAKPLSAIGQGTRKALFRAPVDDQDDLRGRVEGVLIDQGWFVHARCSTTVGQLGVVLAPGDLVALTGAGTRHSGNYLVWSVDHWIKGSDHRMFLELYRNAWSA
jgi:hypothetical protein